MKPEDLLAAMTRTVEQLAAFNEIAKALTSTLETREVLALVMQKVSELMQPNNWSLVLQNEAGRLYFEICVGEGSEKLKELTFLPGEGIAGSVFESGSPRLVPDVSLDPAFAPRFDAASTFRTRSIVAVPLRSKGRSLGVIELVNSSSARVFTEDDVQTLSGIADYAAIAIENARNFKQVQELTLNDEHTNLFNARHLRAVLEKEVARARRFRHPLSLIFLDLDGFKQVNDTHGHMVGSTVLREVGTLLTDALRQVDLGFRYGGDEFAVLLIETDAAGARVMGERICSRFRETNFLAKDGLCIGLTASVGVATFPDAAESALQLLEAADKAMYQAKRQGKNNVQSAAPQTDKPSAG